MRHVRQDRHRVKISTTVDPDLLQVVDKFVEEYPEFNRSRVIDDALRLWYLREQEKAMEAQFDVARSPQEQEEHIQWRRIQQAAAERIFRRQ